MLQLACNPLPLEYALKTGNRLIKIRIPAARNCAERRPVGLKIRYPQGCVGSTPAPGTIEAVTTGRQDTVR